MKLFNTARYKLISTTGLKKYALYAIGEIILVVAGILIALSINNLNEDRKAAQELQQVGHKVANKITTDIENIDKLLEVIKVDKELYELYLSKESISEKEKRNLKAQTPFLVTYSVEVLNLNSTISSSLEKVTIVNDSLSEKLLSIESLYNESEKVIQLTEEVVVNELLANINYIKSNYDWYEKLVNFESFTEAEFAYFKSTDYRNRVVHMKSLYIESYGGQLSLLAATLRKELADLQKLL